MLQYFANTTDLVNVLEDALPGGAAADMGHLEYISDPRQRLALGLRYHSTVHATVLDWKIDFSNLPVLDESGNISNELSGWG